MIGRALRHEKRRPRHTTQTTEDTFHQAVRRTHTTHNSRVISISLVCGIMHHAWLCRAAAPARANSPLSAAHLFPLILLCSHVSFDALPHPLSFFSLFQMHMLGRVVRHATSASVVAARSPHPHLHASASIRIIDSAATSGLQVDALGHGTTARAVSSVPVRNALSVRRAVHTNVPLRSSAGVNPPSTSGTDVFAQAQQDVAATLHNPPPSIRSVIVRLLQSLSSKKEVDHYLKYYGGHSQDGNNFAGQNETDTSIPSGSHASRGLTLLLLCLLLSFL